MPIYFLIMDLQIIFDRRKKDRFECEHFDNQRENFISVIPSMTVLVALPGILISPLYSPVAPAQLQ